MENKKTFFVDKIANKIFRLMYINNKVQIVKNDHGLLDKIQGPALIIGNHSNSLDSLYTYTSMKPHVRWVAGAYLFKNPITRFAIKNLADCISKQQGRSDLSTIKEISRSLKKGDIVGLYPEGTRTWDGNTLDLNMKATTKLIKIFKVPVYFLKYEGAYDLQPRWADYRRNGKLTINLAGVISPEQLKTTPLNDLIATVSENMRFNHDQWQERAKEAFPCEHSAEGIQRLFYICPICGNTGTISGNGNIIRCSSCNTEDTLNDYLFLENNSFNYKSLAKWNQFQKKTLKENNLSFSKDKGDFLRIGTQKGFKMLSKDYETLLEKDSISFFLKDGEDMTFELSKITNMILSVKQSIELYYDNTLYSFRLNDKANSLKYYQAWRDQ